MSPTRKLKAFITQTTLSGRKDSKRSTLRKQIFWERQINAMKRWGQVSVVAWK